MSGRETKRWPDELRRALERRVLDEHVSAAQAAREASAGQLRRELAGDKLPPYKIPDTSVRYIVDTERDRRKALIAEAATLSDPNAATDEMSLQLLAEMRREMNRMSRAVNGKGDARKRVKHWDELQAAAKTLEAVKRATLTKGDRSNTPTESANGAEAPSFLQGLASAHSAAKWQPSQTTTEATTPRQEPTTSDATHVQDAEAAA